jgi:hypothetical protein
MTDQGKTKGQPYEQVNRAQPYKGLNMNARNPQGYQLLAYIFSRLGFGMGG